MYLLVSEHLLDLLPRKLGLGAARERDVGVRMGQSLPSDSQTQEKRHTLMQSEPTVGKKGMRQVRCVVPLQVRRLKFPVKHGGHDMVAHSILAAEFGSWKSWPHFAVPYPDVWHDCGITHNASQEVKGLEFGLERGR